MYISKELLGPPQLQLQSVPCHAYTQPTYMGGWGKLKTYNYFNPSHSTPREAVHKNIILINSMSPPPPRED